MLTLAIGEKSYVKYIGLILFSSVLSVNCHGATNSQLGLAQSTSNVTLMVRSKLGLEFCSLDVFSSRKHGISEEANILKNPVF